MSGSEPPLPLRVAGQRPPTWLTVLLTLAAVVVVTVLVLGAFAGGVVVGSRLDDGPDSAVAAPGPAVDPVPAPGPADAPTTPPAPDGGAGAPAAADPDLDPCLVGTWEVVDHEELYDTEEGRATVTGLTRTLEITADGRETVTYDGDRATLSVEGGSGEIVFDGTVVYQVTTSGGTMSFELLSSEGTVTIIPPGGEEQVEDLTPGVGDVNYTCSGDSFIQEAQGYRSVMTRTG